MARIHERTGEPDPRGAVFETDGFDHSKREVHVDASGSSIWIRAEAWLHGPGLLFGHAIEEVHLSRDEARFVLERLTEALAPAPAEPAREAEGGKA